LADPQSSGPHIVLVPEHVTAHEVAPVHVTGMQFREHVIEHA
jgi:hypothetical protein